MIAKVRVLASTRTTPSVHTIRFERPPGFDFAPVQFCGLELATDEGPIEYSMSLASSPTRPHLEFGARISDSAWKRAFAALQPGDVAEIDGPYGRFVLDPTRPAIFVAGGVGITPLKGMLEYATDKQLPIPVRLVYSSRSETEIAYRAELAALAAANPNARILHTLTRPDAAWDGRRGRIGADILQEAAVGLTDARWYICGKPEMVANAVHTLDALGIPRDACRWEQFHGY